MKHYFPLAAAAAFAIWTYALIAYQKWLIHKKLNAPSVKSKIEEKMDGLVDRIIPDLALPFLPPSLLSKLKSKGTEELVKFIPQFDEEVDRQFKKYSLWVLFLAALFGLGFGILCTLAAGAESNG